MDRLGGQLLLVYVDGIAAAQTISLLALVAARALFAIRARTTGALLKG